MKSKENDKIELMSKKWQEWGETKLGTLLGSPNGNKFLKLLDKAIHNNN